MGFAQRVNQLRKTVFEENDYNFITIFSSHWTALKCCGSTPVLRRISLNM